MLADSYIVPQCKADPRTLGALMALYEGNFIKLTALAPALLSPSPARAAQAALPAAQPALPAAQVALQTGSPVVSRTARDLDLHLCVDAVTRYTVDLRLTYFFDDPAGPEADPDLHLRLYVDARMVEVISWSVSHRHEVLRQLALKNSRELDRRWSRNIMLGKWLDYLADRGHAFRP
ncbi:MAG: DUF1249 domain-containing protein [Gammaproteobacteria bacterium]